jgi:hypothetical protein
MASYEPLSYRLRRKIPRLQKYCRHSLRQLTRGREDSGPKLVFVLGAQRSGTRLPLVVMDRCPDIITFNEGSSAFFDRVMLRSDEEIRARLRRIPVPVVVLKPICESHRAVDLLDSFPASRVVWIYRGYRAVTRSASAKWASGVAHLRSLAAGMDVEAAWRAGGMTQEKYAFVRDVYAPDMSLDAANAVFWHLRTSLFLDLKLHERADVLLVRYEDLAREPQRFFPRMFEFLNREFHPRYLDTVRPSPDSSPTLNDVPGPIAEACERLEHRMDEAYHRALAGGDGVRAFVPSARRDTARPVASGSFNASP